MAVAYRSTGALGGADSGNVASLGLPSGHVANDLLIIEAVQHDNVASTVSGWTLLSSQTNGANMTYRVFGKFDNGAESAPTITHTAGGTIHAKMHAFSGVDPTLTLGTGAGAVLKDIQYATGSGTGNLTITIPAVTGAAAGDLLVAASAGDTTDTSGSASNNWGPPSGFTERFDNGRVGAAASNISETATVAAGSGGATSSALTNSFGGTMFWIGAQFIITTTSPPAPRPNLPLLPTLRRFSKLPSPFQFPPLSPPVVVTAVSDITVTQDTAGILTLTADANVIASAMPQVVGVLTLTAGANATTITAPPTVGVLTLTYNAATLVEQVNQTVGILNLVADAATLVTGFVVNPSVGTLTLTSGTNVIASSVSPSGGLLTLTAGANTFTSDVQIQATTGVLILTGGSHTITGPAVTVTTITSRHGFAAIRDPEIIKEFVQVAFDKVRATTQSIKDVLK